MNNCIKIFLLLFPIMLVHKIIYLTPSTNFVSKQKENLATLKKSDFFNENVLVAVNGHAILKKSYGYSNFDTRGNLNDSLFLSCPETG